MAMAPIHKNALTQKRVFLVNNIILSEEFFGFLTADRSITPSMKEEIEAHSRTSPGRIGKLLDFLPKRHARAFDTLLRALVETDQEHIAVVLDKNRTSQLVKSRDKKRSDGVSEHATAVQPSSSDMKSDPSAVVPSSSNVGEGIQLTDPTLPPTSTTGIINFSPATQGHVSGNLSNFQPRGSTSHSQPAAVDPASSLVGPTSSVSFRIPEPCSSMQPTSPQQEDPRITLAEDEVDIVNYLATEVEGLDIVSDISSDRGSQQAIQRGMVVLICNGSVQNAKFGGNDIITSIANCALCQFFDKLNFTVNDQMDLTAAEIIAYLKKNRQESSVKACDAFIFMFIGFGNSEGMIYGHDGACLSITNDILPLFAADCCPSLKGKPKIFLFQLAEPDPVDSVDAKTLSQDDSLWSDFIVFVAYTSCLNDKMLEDSDKKQQMFNLMYRALIKVTSKFLGQLPFHEILQKVRTILLSQPMRDKSGCSIRSPEIIVSPHSCPVFL